MEKTKELQEKVQLNPKISEDKKHLKSLYYSDYLELDTVLNSQKLQSEMAGKPAHDEMLFVIVHQTFELWFKQILHELEAVMKLMNKEYIPERELGRVIHHLGRVIEIQKLLVHQFDVLETMTPLDFMDFRDFLIPASGFQSYQFRILENVLGLRPESRIEHEKKSYHYKLSPEHQKLVKQSEENPNLFGVIEKWLERIPFLNIPDLKYNFLEEYKNAVEKMFNDDKKVIMNHMEPDSTELKKELERIEENKNSFIALFHDESHKVQIEKGLKRLSFKGTQAALLIHVYQDEPILQLPHKLLTCLVDIDEQLALWRYKHALMVQRMIGTKVGTGGSSGYWYLKSTIERGKIFRDISNLSTYIIPRADVPALPPAIQKSLGFISEVTLSKSGKLFLEETINKKNEP